MAESALSYYRTVGKVVPGSNEAIAAEAEYYDKVRQNIDLLTLLERGHRTEAHVPREAAAIR